MKIDLKLAKEDYTYNVYVNELKSLKFKGKVAIISNAKISGLHIQTLLKHITANELFIITIKDGEKYKNLETIEYILEQLFISGLDRSSTIISFGGGVISDMVGFVASIYKRGINFISIPTTLLAQVDASVGGKTGINNKWGKNLIGTFYQPLAVYCQTEWLLTLPKREFAAGMAEVVKMAVCFDKDFFEWLEKSNLSEKQNLEYLISRCIQIKANIVQNDEKEKGIRAILNYGHTFAHVIENETNYESYLHGEAVAIGMDMANALALNLGLIQKNEKERIKLLLQKLELPTDYKIKNPEKFYESFFMDKKTQNNKINFIMPKGIGNALIKSDIEKNQIMQILKQYT